MRRLSTLETVFLVAFLCCGCGAGGGKGVNSSASAGHRSGTESTTNRAATDQGGSTATGAAGGGPKCGAIPVDEGFIDVAASDPGIRYVGRFDFDDPEAPRMMFPAVTVETEFEGDAIDLRLKEGAPGTASTNTEYYAVTIDGGEPVKLQTCPAQEIYPLARALGSGTHRVRISKRTEGSVGSALFLGFRVREAGTLHLPKAPERRVEFVGDSITCGYGNEVSTTDPDSYSFTSTNENALLAYGAVAAAELGADYVAVAASGRGMVRNYSGGSGLHAPEFYELAGPDSGAVAWDHTLYSPDVVVVNLGTNDFSIGLEADEVVTMREEYRATYTKFLSRLRVLHPKATLIAVVGPMISDSYPPGYQAWTSIRADVQEVVQSFVDDGDSKVLYFALSPQSSPYGEDWHPTLATHQKMADALSAFIKEELGW